MSMMKTIIIIMTFSRLGAWPGCDADVMVVIVFLSGPFGIWLPKGRHLTSVGGRLIQRSGHVLADTAHRCEKRGRGSVA